MDTAYVIYHSRCKYVGTVTERMQRGKQKNYNNNNPWNYNHHFIGIDRWLWEFIEVNGERLDVSVYKES